MDLLQRVFADMIHLCGFELGKRWTTLKVSNLYHFQRGQVWPVSKQSYTRTLEPPNYISFQVWIAPWYKLHWFGNLAVGLIITSLIWWKLTAFKGSRSAQFKAVPSQWFGTACLGWFGSTSLYSFGLKGLADPHKNTPHLMAIWDGVKVVGWCR